MPAMVLVIVLTFLPIASVQFWAFIVLWFFILLVIGDMIITGSPHGNGSHFGRFLRDRDVMGASITGLGTQRSTVRGPVLHPHDVRRGRPRL